MENRNSSTSSRPFSVNNPFRNATVDSSINQYKNDSQFQEWAKNQSRTNSFDMPQLNTRTSSQLSFPNIPEDEPQRNADQQGAFILVWRALVVVVYHHLRDLFPQRILS